MATKLIPKETFYMIEGGDYAGKSTLIKKLQKKYPEFIYTREPGSLLKTENAVKCEQIRNRLLTEDLSNHEQACLFAESRKMHTEDILELIDKGRTVVSDRHISSSMAYQGYAGGISKEEIIRINQESLDMIKENGVKVIVLWLHINKKTYHKRKQLRMQNAELDVIEKKDEEFFKKVREFFNEENLSWKFKLAMDYNMAFHPIDANQSIEDVFEDACNIIEQNKFIEVKEEQKEEELEENLTW